MSKIVNIPGKASRGKRAVLQMIDDIWDEQYKEFFDKIDKNIDSIDIREVVNEKENITVKEWMCETGEVKFPFDLDDNSESFERENICVNGEMKMTTNQTVKEQIEKCYSYLDDIEDFLDEYDEYVGLGWVKDCPDYNEAIAALRNTLYGIKYIR